MNPCNKCLVDTHCLGSKVKLEGPHICDTSVQSPQRCVACMASESFLGQQTPRSNPPPPMWLVATSPAAAIAVLERPAVPTVLLCACFEGRSRATPALGHALSPVVKWSRFTLEPSQCDASGNADTTHLWHCPPRVPRREPGTDTACGVQSLWPSLAVGTPYTTRADHVTGKHVLLSETPSPEPLVTGRRAPVRDASHLHAERGSDLTPVRERGSAQPPKGQCTQPAGRGLCSTPITSEGGEGAVTCGTMAALKAPRGPHLPRESPESHRRVYQHVHTPRDSLQGGHQWACLHGSTWPTSQSAPR